MIRALKNEKWKILEFEDDISEDEHFKISTYGRILNCKTDQEFLVKKSSDLEFFSIPECGIFKKNAKRKNTAPNNCAPIVGIVVITSPSFSFGQ